METTFGKLEIGKLFYSGYDNPRTRIYRKTRMAYVPGNNADCVNGSGGAQFGPASPVITVTGA